MEWINVWYFVNTFLVLAGLKAILIGSEFNFYLWSKYGKDYMLWYGKREEFPKE